MKRIYILGRAQDTSPIFEVFAGVNAEARQFSTLEEMINQARLVLPNLFIVAMELASRTDAAIQQLRRDSLLTSAAILAYYPDFVVRAQARGRANGANEVLYFPVDRRELLARSATLLHIDKRRTFKTMVTIEYNGRAVVGRTEDFSSAGISFVSDDGIQEREEVRLQFFLPGDSERIRLQATVMRKISLPENKYFYGARFVEIDQTVGQRLQNFIDRVK